MRVPYAKLRKKNEKQTQKITINTGDKGVILQSKLRTSAAFGKLKRVSFALTGTEVCHHNIIVNSIKETTMAENQTPTTPKKSRREQFGERLKKKYPDREYADDEALFGQIDDDYADYDNQLNQYKERESRLTDLFSKDPRSAQFITDMAKGNDPWIAVLERLGIDGVTDLLNDPSKQAEYAEANKKYVERLAKSKELDEEFNKNMPETLSMLEQVQQERGLGDETIDAAWELIERIGNEALVGKISRETLDMALNAVTHDADVNNARTEGTVAGRNAKIDETLRKPQQGDGTPNLAGSNNAPTRKSANRSMFDLADEAR